jgi:hypothetical protein
VGKKTLAHPTYSNSDSNNIRDGQFFKKPLKINKFGLFYSQKTSEVLKTSEV